MFIHEINHEDFVQVLGALPDPPAVVRAYLVGRFGVLVTGDDPRAWWTAMWRDRGEEGAAKVVSQLIISHGGKRVLSLIKAEADGRYAAARADDPKLVRMLFDESQEDFLTDQEVLRSIVCEYYEETRTVLEEEDERLPDSQDEFEDESFEEAEEDEDSDEDDIDLLDLFSGKPRPSAHRGAEWTLERVQSPPRGFLTVPVQFKEADLENFLWANWERIDFGFDRPIYLVGKQKVLSAGTSDRVDLLAKGKSGEHITIELKIVEARGGDYTQLVSYMGNLESSGVRTDKVRGVLIAPAFSQKVLNSASIEPRVTLLRFHKGS